MWLKESLKYVGGLALAGVLLWWVLRGTDPAELWAQLQQASILGLLAAGLTGVAHNVFRVLRWRALLEPVRPNIPFRPMFDAVILGYAISWAIPGRLGEVVRPALLSGRERLPLGPCLGSVVADRLLDGMAILVLFGAGIALTPLTNESLGQANVLRGSAIALVFLIAVPIVVLLVAAKGRARIERMLAGRRGVRGWLGRMLLSLSQGVEALGRPALLARIAVYTLLAWLTIAASTWFGIRACGVEIPFTGVWIILPMLALGIALPTPGGAGGYHAMMQVGLMQFFGVGEALATGTGILVHAAVVLPVILLGVVLLMVGRIPIQDLVAAARQVRGLGASPAPPPGGAKPAEKLK